ncbi:MAG: PAS domain S-box protein, partial [Candidatus Omnitrophota bacterium]
PLSPMRALLLSFFKNELDYVFFFYGLGFVILGFVCAAMSRQQRQSISWVWLAAFGFSHGLNEWLDLLALDLFESPGFAVVRVGVMAVSFVCLIEFSRKNIKPLSGSKKGMIFYSCAAVIIAVGGFAQPTLFNVMARYFLGLTGALGAAVVCWNAKDSMYKKQPLRAAGWAMALYALATGLVVPRAGVFPASVVNHEAFFDFFGLPIQLIRGLLACMVAFFIWRYSRRDILWDNAADQGRGSLNDSRWIVIVLVAIVAGGWVMARHIAKVETRSLERRLTDYAGIAVAGIDSEIIQRLSGTSGDLESPDYARIKAQLTKIRAASPGTRFTYITGRRNGSVYFYADSEDPKSTDYSPPGQIYEEAAKEFSICFDAGLPGVVGPVTDRWGTWVSGLAPIKDVTSGRVIAVLGADMQAADWERRIHTQRLIAISITGLLCLILFVFFAAWESLRRASFMLLRGQRRYSAIIEGSPDILCLLDRQGRFVQINKLGCKKLGLGEGSLLGRPFTNIFSQEQIPLILESFSRAISGGQHVTCETIYRQPHGTPLNMRVSLSAVPGTETEQESVVATMTDMTVQKKAEAELGKQVAYEREAVLCLAALLKDADQQRVLEEVLGLIGVMTGVERVCLFKNLETDEDGAFAALAACVGVSDSLIKEPFFRHLSYEPDLVRWQRSLAKGAAVFGCVSELPQCEQVLLAPLHALSILAIPTVNRGSWSGFVLLTNAKIPQVWSAGDVNFLQTIVNAVCVYQDKKEAESQLEKKITDLESMNQLVVGRELRMIELKAKNAELEARLEGKLASPGPGMGGPR